MDQNLSEGFKIKVGLLYLELGREQGGENFSVVEFLGYPERN